MAWTCTVAVIGAGPYGLAVSSHLRDAGIEARVFGPVMRFWRDHMPTGMLLRSERMGSHIADPRRALTLDKFERMRGAKLPRRMPLSDFVTYGQWYQRRAAPDVDERQIARVTTEAGGFRLLLEDGDAITAKRVVVATGLTSFASRPPAFASIPLQLAPHSYDLRDPGSFAGLSVAIIGAGQSALELAALLHEAD